MLQTALPIADDSMLAGSSVAIARLPTNTTTKQHAVHRWFNFIAGFSPEFVSVCCERARKRGARLLDPFAGCGTALVEGVQHGYTAIGYEPHPVFARIARAKIPNTSWKKVDAIEAALLAGFSQPAPVGDLPEAPRLFLTKLFDKPAIESLFGARRKLDERGLGQDDLAFLMLSRVLDQCSRSQTDGIYKAPTSEKVARSPEKACRDTADMIRGDLAGWPSTARSGHIHEHSAESMHETADGSVDLIVTSPPYLNNFDFAEMTRMQLYFWGIASSWGEITQRVRSQLVVNTTTALMGHKDKQAAYKEQVPAQLRGRLDEVVSELRVKRAERPGKKEYDFLIYPYFKQMTAILRECWRTLRPGAEIHVMVADAALYGVHISTPQLLAEIMEVLGFEDVACSQVRRRGHRWILNKRDGSPIGLGEYHLHARK